MLSDNLCICVVGIDGQWSWSIRNWDGVTVMKGKKTKKSAAKARRIAERKIGRG